MIKDFIMDNFFYLHPGYTTFNTIIFGLVLGLIILGIIKIFDVLDKDPLDLIYPLIPIIVFGSTSRALVDNGIYPRIHLLATPGIYIFIGLMTIVLLLASIIVEKHSDVKYQNVIAIAGSAMCVPNLVLIIFHGINLKVTLLELFLFVVISAIFILLKNKMELLRTRGNLEVLLAHVFDATSTFVAMDFFGYYEQHVLPTLLINFTHTAFVMYPLKIGVIILILYIIDSQVNDKLANNMLKLSIFILGLAPGIRNFTTLILSLA